MRRFGAHKRLLHEDIKIYSKLKFNIAIYEGDCLLILIYSQITVEANAQHTLRFEELVVYISMWQESCSRVRELYADHGNGATSLTVAVHRNGIIAR